MISSILFVFVTFIYGKSNHLQEDLSSSKVEFIKPKTNIMRRLNPLKLFFTVVHTPHQYPYYLIEWNLPFLQTMLLESTYVSDDDKALFMKFSNAENDYAKWSPEQHDQLERFTEKYFNLYKSPNLFLPFLDCSALTYAITDEMLNDARPYINDKIRSKIRAIAVERLCNIE